MSRSKLAGFIVACAVVVVVAIVLVVFRPWEGPASAQTYTLTTAVDPAGTGSVSPSGGQYESGVQVTITASAASGYVFDYWSGSASGTLPSINITMNHDHSLRANFVVASVDRHDLSISSTEGGSATTPGEGTLTYEEGTVVDLVAEAEEGHHFVNWTGDVDTIANVNAPSTTITINDNYSVTANFQHIPPGKVALTTSSTTGGSVTTPGEGAFLYNGGEVVSLVATPATGYRFVDWTSNVGAIANVNAASTTITMNGDYSIRANFEETLPEEECILTISSTAGGFVTTPGEGEFIYECGDVGSLVATPDSGYRFVNWTGDVDTIAVVGDPTTAITVNANYSITAEFAEIQTELSLDPSPLMSGVDSICALGGPGPLAALTSIPISIAAGDDDTTPPLSVVVMASRLGKGRVVAFGHEGFFTNEALDLFDNRQFANNVVDWLDKSGKREILVTTAHEEWDCSGSLGSFRTELESHGYTVTGFGGTIAASLLSDVGVVFVIHAAGDVLQSEIDALTNFVTDGGGLFLVGLGWSWEAYHGPLDDYPMNKIAEPYGIQWIDGYISDPTDNYEGQPIFHTFYPSIFCDDECQQATPQGYVHYYFDEDSKFLKYEVVFSWTDTPELYDVGIYPAVLLFGFECGEGGYAGPQIGLSNSGEKTVKRVLFSIWDPTEDSGDAQPITCPNCNRFGGEGTGAQCSIHNDPDATKGKYYEQIWEEGKQYKITVQKEETQPDGVVWNATIEDLETGVETLIGQIKLDNQDPYEGYGLLCSYRVGGFFEYFYGNRLCLEAEYGKIIRIGPIAGNGDGLWLPRKATYEHPACIRAITYSPELGVIVQEVGAGVERDPEDTLEGILWEFGHDIPLSQLPELQDLFE